MRRKETRANEHISIACALVSALGGCAWALLAAAAIMPSPALAAEGYFDNKKWL